MILLDTNVISELWRQTPDAHVLIWIDAQSVDTLYLSAVTIAEIRFGIAIMPMSKRQETLQRRLEQDVLPLFEGRILPFDLNTSKAYARLMAGAKAAGKAIGKADAYIAAIAATHSLIVATRDTSPFKAAGVRVVNPWQPS